MFLPHVSAAFAGRADEDVLDRKDRYAEYEED
jgi:hypothetical protein